MEGKIVAGKERGPSPHAAKYYHSIIELGILYSKNELDVSTHISSLDLI
jgi:hypothetical protein